MSCMRIRKINMFLLLPYSERRCRPTVPTNEANAARPTRNMRWTLQPLSRRKDRDAKKRQVAVKGAYDGAQRMQPQRGQARSERCANAESEDALQAADRRREGQRELVPCASVSDLLRQISVPVRDKLGGRRTAYFPERKSS